MATSLRIELGKPVLRAELATAILRELDVDYARVNQGKFPALADEWEAAVARRLESKSLWDLANANYAVERRRWMMMGRCY
jgi:biotin-(acetyl-CoA carboxylase) ligase